MTATTSEDCRAGKDRGEREKAHVSVPAQHRGRASRPSKADTPTRVDAARAALTGTPIGQHLAAQISTVLDRLTALEAVRSDLQAQLRQLDRLQETIARLTPQQIASIPPETPLDWLEAFARSAPPHA
jgi:hypothetical protein